MSASCDYNLLFDTDIDVRITPRPGDPTNETPSYSVFFQGFKSALATCKTDDIFRDSSGEASVETCLFREFVLAVKGLLNLYVQENYTGPPLTWDGEMSELLKSLEACVEISSTDFVLDGEAVIENVKHINLVLGAEYFLGKLNSLFDYYPSLYWWRIRAYFLHQSFLEEKSSILWNLIQEDISSFQVFLTPDVQGRENATIFYLELCEIYSFYYDIETAKGLLVKAKETIGLSANTTGVLGKRTKFQQTQIAQLVLNVEFEDKTRNVIFDGEDGIPAIATRGSFPNAVVLDDEDRLDKLQLTDAPFMTAASLSSVEHLVLISNFGILRKYLPHDGVYLEELLAYITFLIENPKVWSIQMVSLVQRSILELHNRRTVERSMKQLELLHKLIVESEPSAMHRLKYFHGSGLPMKWEIEVSLCQVLSSLHLFKEALEISLRLNRWEDVIRFYTHLNLRHKAEEVIQEKLSVSPSVKLWILLGDATDNAEYYNTAWKLSNERSARAQRQWGYFHFVRKQYAEAIPHLQKSLELNPLENPTWIRLGYSALITENWSLSTKAYQHSSTLDGDNFEIWNNLANGFIKLNEKKKALRALKEACKCNYDNWKVWDNTLVVATDCKAFDEVFRAYHRLIDLKGKWADEQVLELLVKAIVTNLPDASDKPSRDRYYKDALKLFGRISSLVTTNPKIWKLYSDLLFVDDEKHTSEESQLDWSKGMSFAQKSVECILADNTWAKVEMKMEEAVDFTVEYIKRVKEFVEKNPDTSSEVVTKAQFTIKRVYGGIKRERNNAIVQEGFEKYLTEIRAITSTIGIQLEE